MNKTTINTSLSTLALALSLLAAGNVQAEWLKSYGTGNFESGFAMPSAMGGYYLSINGIPQAKNTKPSTLLSLLNANGKPLWTKKISSGAYGTFFLHELSNGRLLLNGTTSSSSNGPNDPVWALYNVNRTTGALTPVFSKTYKGKGNDELFLFADNAGGLLGTGSTTSFSQTGGEDLIVAKVNPNTGALVWSKVFDYDYKDSAVALLPKGKQLILLAHAEDATQSNQKILLGLLQGNGAPVAGSFKKYGAAGINTASIKPIANGNYLVYGTNKTSLQDNNPSAFIMKLNANLGLVWRKKYSAGADQGLSFENINENANGSFTASGTLSTTEYFTQGGIHIPLYTAQHPTVVQLSATGAVSSSKSFEYQAMDTAFFLKKTDGSYLLSGSTMPFDLTGGTTPQSDGLYGHFSAGFAPDWVKTFGGASANDYSTVIPQGTGYLLSGGTGSFGAGGSDAVVGKLDANGDVPGCKYINEVTMTETAPKITVGNLNWQAQAINLTSKGSISSANMPLTVTSATLKVTTACSH